MLENKFTLIFSFFSTMMSQTVSGGHLFESQHHFFVFIIFFNSFYDHWIQI